MEKSKTTNYTVNIIKGYGLIKKWFWALPLWKRTIITSSIGAISGSVVLTFINKYALYFHAYSFGFRIPVEGVDYIDFAVSLLSFGVILVTVIGTILIYYFLDSLSQVIEKVLGLFASFRSEQIGQLLNSEIISKLLVSVFGLSVSLVSVIIRSEVTSETNLSKVGGVLVTSLILIASVFTLGTTLFKSDRNRKIITLSAVLIGILILACSLFYQPVYSKFLSSIKFGGKVPVEIDYRDGDNSNSIISGQLLLRSRDGCIVLVDSSRISEIPTSRVNKITIVND